MRDVVKGRRKLSYKHLGINISSENCDFNIYEREVINSNSYSNGQPDSPFLFSYNGGRDSQQTTLREKCPYLKFFWSVFSRIRTEYGEIRSISVFSPNAGKYGPEKLRIWTLFTECNC